MVRVKDGVGVKVGQGQRLELGLSGKVIRPGSEMTTTNLRTSSGRHCRGIKLAPKIGLIKWSDCLEIISKCNYLDIFREC